MTDNKLKNMEKYRMTDEEIDSALFQAKQTGLDLFDIARKIRQFQYDKLLPLLEEVKREERERVVEWVEANLTYPTRGEGICFERNLEWQSKLKEWGLQQGKEGE